jgi:hypothetical protein
MKTNAITAALANAKPIAAKAEKKAAKPPKKSDVTPAAAAGFADAIANVGKSETAQPETKPGMIPLSDLSLSPEERRYRLLRADGMSQEQAAQFAFGGKQSAQGGGSGNRRSGPTDTTIVETGFIETDRNLTTGDRTLLAEEFGIGSTLELFDKGGNVVGTFTMVKGESNRTGKEYLGLTGKLDLAIVTDAGHIFEAVSLDRNFRPGDCYLSINRRHR